MIHSPVRYALVSLIILLLALLIISSAYHGVNRAQDAELQRPQVTRCKDGDGWDEEYRAARPLAAAVGIEDG